MASSFGMFAEFSWRAFLSFAMASWFIGLNCFVGSLACTGELAIRISSVPSAQYFFWELKPRDGIPRL